MSRDGLSVIEKATLILEYFVSSGSPSLSFVDVRVGVDLPATTTHRLLAELVEHGWLIQRDARGDYAIGPLLLSLGVLAEAGAQLRSAADAHMRRLRDECGETVIVAELHGDAVVPVLRADGLFEMRMNQRVGAQYPAYAGATGKVLLAFLPTAELEEYLDGLVIERLTSRTVSDAVQLRADLDLVRRLGVGVSRGERVEAAVAISAPILDRHDEVVGALTISGVASRFDRDALVDAARSTRQAAAAISKELGSRRDTAAGRDREDIDDPRSEAFSALAALCDDVIAPETSRKTGVVAKSAVRRRS